MNANSIGGVKFTERRITTLLLGIVCIAAITISTWSLMKLGLLYHVPPFVAAFASAAYDGGAIFCSWIAMRWARSTMGAGVSARLAALMFMGSAVWLNYEHGRLIKAPLPVSYMFALSSVVSLVCLEVFLRFTRRRSIKRALPRIDVSTWVLFPFKSFKALRNIVGQRLERLTDQPLTGNDGVSSSASERTNEVSTWPKPLSTQAQMRQWAWDQGYQVAERGAIPSVIQGAYIRAMSNASSNGQNGSN